MGPSKTARLKVITDTVFEIVDLLLTGEDEDIEGEEVALAFALLPNNEGSMKRKREGIEFPSSPTVPLKEVKLDNTFERLQETVLTINREMKLISEFAHDFKMTKTTLESLCLSIGDAVTSQYSISYGGKPSLSVVKQILLTVWLLVNQESFSLIAKRFNTSKSSALVTVRRVCTALVQVAGDVIVWPNSGRAQETATHFLNKCGIPGIVGVLDAIHIRVRAMEALPEAYRNSEGLPTIILQAICDENLMFIDCYAGLLGSHTKDEVYYDCDLHHKVLSDASEIFPGNSHLIGDESYLIDQHLLTPYCQRFEQPAGEQLFNNSIYKALETINLAFAHLKTRFSRLNNLVMSRVDLVPNVSVACIVLHNMCIQAGDTLDSSLIDVSTLANIPRKKKIYDKISGQELNHTAGVEKRNEIKSSLYSTDIWYD